MELGLYHWQLWVTALARFGLQPLFKKTPPSLQAGGIGGGQSILVVCFIPMGIAGAQGLMEWAVIEDPNENDHTPALLSNPYLIDVDAVIEPKDNRMTLRSCNDAVANLVRLPSLHHSTSMLDFGDTPWSLSDELEQKVC